jgi:hypothetical protein
MSLHKTLLEAAKSLPETFTPEDLTVAAHRLCQATLALAGYPELPNHHRTTVAIYGKKGLIARGHFSWKGKRLRLGKEPRPLPPECPAPTAHEREQSRTSAYEACRAYIRRTGESPMMAWLTLHGGMA